MLLLLLARFLPLLLARVLVSLLALFLLSLLLVGALLSSTAAIEFELLSLELLLNELVQDVVDLHFILVLQLLDELPVVDSEVGGFVAGVACHLNDGLNLVQVGGDRVGEFVFWIFRKQFLVFSDLVYDLLDALYFNNFNQVDFVVDGVDKSLFILRFQFETSEHLQNDELQLVGALFEEFEILDYCLYDAVVGVEHLLVPAELFFCLVGVAFLVEFYQFIVLPVVDKLLTHLFHYLIQTLLQFLV